jgi:hypothetical protein
VDGLPWSSKLGTRKEIDSKRELTATSLLSGNRSSGKSISRTRLLAEKKKRLAGVILGSCETHDRSVGSLINTNVDFYSVVLWHPTPPSGTGRTLPQPVNLTRYRYAVTGSRSLDPLVCHIPAIIDKLLDISGIEPQRTPAGTHLDRRNVGSALAGSVLDDPRNAHPQFVRHILRLDKLAYWPRFYTDDRRVASEVTSV